MGTGGWRRKGIWWHDTHLCWHCSAMGAARPSFDATSRRPGVRRRSAEHAAANGAAGTAPSGSPASALTVCFFDLLRGPLRRRPVERLRVRW